MKKINLSSKKWEEIRTVLKNNDWNVTSTYQELTAKENMFGYAFFGWHTTPYQKQKLEHIWRGVLFIKMEEDKNQPIWLKEQTKTYLEINQ